MINLEQKLKLKLNRQKIDTIKFCYYPFYDNNNDNVMKLKTLTGAQIKNIILEIDHMISNHIKGTYIEYGIRDTFMRVTDLNPSTSNSKEFGIAFSENEKKGTSNSKETNRMCFQREMFTTRLKSCDGIFVIEMYTKCDEDEFPVIINYPHYQQCSVDTYIINTNNDENNPLRLCFTKIEDSKYVLSKDTIYFNVCRDVHINNTVNITNEFFKFIKDVSAFKNTTTSLLI